MSSHMTREARSMKQRKSCGKRPYFRANRRDDRRVAAAPEHAIDPLRHKFHLCFTKSARRQRRRS